MARAPFAAPSFDIADPVLWESASGRAHLEGLRRGVLFLVAIATALFLFTDVGWRVADASKSSRSACVGRAKCITPGSLPLPRRGVGPLENSEVGRL